MAVIPYNSVAVVANGSVAVAVGSDNKKEWLRMDVQDPHTRFSVKAHR